MASVTVRAADQGPLATPPAYDVVLPSAVVAANVRNLLRSALGLAYRIETSGESLVPRRGPVILVCQHVAVLDGAVLLAASPRPVHLMAGQLSAGGAGDRILRALGQLPFDQDHPDRESLHQAAALLVAGRAVAMFPEGRCGTGEVTHLRHPVAYLVAATGAPIVPVAVQGTRGPGGAADRAPRRRSTVGLSFGAPRTVPVEGHPARRAVLARVGERVRQVLADHVAAVTGPAGRAAWSAEADTR
ncbi:MAG: 1-acyl-sn-glycerol-3-phosphate acyltransferase [Actinomycetota bacterium]|nr:MAG: 1-acyl-sn-glycerol-3-phosphate acyltransferase [Actinomycetota bacterium]